MNEEACIGRPVQSLQQMLRTLNFGTDASLLTPTGQFDAETERTLKAFQRSVSLPQTGIADLNTWEALVRAYDRAIAEQARAKPLHLTLQRGFAVHPAESHLHLYPLQALLAALGEVLDVPHLEITGRHTNDSVEAVRWLQERADLTPDGIITRPVWDAASMLYSAVVGDGSQE